MLVEAMNYQEISQEVMKDFMKLRSTTEERLAEMYDRERRKLKVDKYSCYPKAYSVKTGTKNNWIIIFRKSTVHEKYKSQKEINVHYIVYYHTAKGLNVISHSNNYHELFYGHFFKRYNERMKLNLDKHVDIVTDYFLNTPEIYYKITTKNNCNATIGVCDKGYLMGEYLPKENFVINKTFVSKDISHEGQRKAEKYLMQFKIRLPQNNY